MSDIGKIPDYLILPSTAPEAVRCYRRRFVSPCTNVASAGPGDFFNIYPDTSTSGSFMDPTSTYLMFDFQILNNNCFVDYANFGVEGVGGAIIQEFRIYNQGTITEEILEYGTAASTFANIEGVYDVESAFYFSNKLSIGYSDEYHRNFIKPPMCDGTGNIMYGPNPFGLGLDSTYGLSSTFLNTSSSTQVVSSTVNKNNGGTGTFIGPSFSVVITDRGLIQGDLSFTNTALTLNAPNWNAGSKAVAVSATNYISITPMDWPELYDPARSNIQKDYVHEFGSVNKPMVMSNLCNVKCFPIGMTAGINPYGGITGAITLANMQTTNATLGATSATVPVMQGGANSTTPNYRICYPLLSGIIGRLATKCLPTCILSPQQMYINIRLATAAVALRLSADPCRRICGTVRDYIRNIGTANGALFGDESIAFAGSSPYTFTTSNFAPGYGPFLSVASTLGTTRLTSYPNTTFSNASCRGLYKVACPYSEIDGTCTITYASATTCTISAISITGLTVLPVGTILQGTNGAVTDADDYLITGYDLSSTTYTVSPGSLKNAGPETLLPFTLPASPNSTLPATPQYALATTPWRYKGSGAGVAVQYANDNQCFYGTYLPYSVPQTARMFSMKYDGTNLRSNFQGASYTPYDQSAGSISYVISNMQLIGDQLILPSSVTKDIIEQASAGGYNVRTKSIRTYNISINQGEVQTIICPLKVSVARKLYFVFQNQTVRGDSTGFYYDSNCGHNPFASISPATNAVDMSIKGFLGGVNTKSSTTVVDLYGVGWTLPLCYRPTCTNTSTNTLSVQLRIGNELYPQQPLTTMEEIAVELTKTYEKWGVKTSFSPNVDSRVLFTNNATAQSTISVPSTATSFYDCLQPNKFCTAFIHQNLMDDQTIIGNYDMVPLFAYQGAAGTANWGTTGLASQAITSNGNGLNYLCPRGYCLNKMFIPPSSRFILGFDMSQFPADTGVACGTYLGNNTITLLMSGCVGLNVKDQTHRMIAVIPHTVVMSFRAGGQLVWNY